MSMFGAFEVLLGIYVLYNAATGTGQLLNNENIKKGKEALFKKWMRIFGALLGPIMIAIGCVDLYIERNPQAALTWLSSLQIGLWLTSLLLVIILAVFSFRMTDRAKAKSGVPGKGSAVPASAFEFDMEVQKKD